MNPQHIKSRLLGNFGKLTPDKGKVGVTGHRVSLNNMVNTFLEVGNWIANPSEKITEKALHDSRYFVVFTNSPSPTIMHQQEELVWVMTDKKHFSGSGDKLWITLGSVDTYYRTQIEGYLKSF